MSNVQQTLLQFVNAVQLRLMHSLLDVTTYLVIDRIKVGAIRRPQIWRNESGCWLLKKSHSVACPVRRCAVFPQVVRQHKITLCVVGYIIWYCLQSNGEKILKIGDVLTKLSPLVGCLLLEDRVYHNLRVRRAAPRQSYYEMLRRDSLKHSDSQPIP